MAKLLKLKFSWHWNSHSSIASCSYQFRITLGLEKRELQCLNLKYDKHSRNKNCGDMDLQQKLFPTGSVCKDFREWFHNYLIKLEVSSVEERNYSMPSFNSKFKYISAGSLNTNIIYLNLKYLIQIYFKSIKKIQKSKWRNPKIFWGRMQLEFAEKYLKF